MALSHSLLNLLPERVQKDVDFLLKHSDGVLKLLSATKDDHDNISQDRYLSELSADLGISVIDAARMVATLENIQILGVEAGSPAKTFELIADRLDENLKSQWESRRDTILKILLLVSENHPVVVSQKAHRLAYSQETLFVDGEILTDARPVFTVAGDRVLEMVILHTLVITRHRGDHRNATMHLAMDAADVIKLKNACDRAMLKATVLKKALSDKAWTTTIFNENEET